VAGLTTVARWIALRAAKVERQKPSPASKLRRNNYADSMSYVLKSKKRTCIDHTVERKKQLVPVR
jgi:hypothetical protein